MDLTLAGMRMMEESIYLQTLGEIGPEALDRIEQAVEETFDLHVEKLRPIEVPEHTFSTVRGQYHSTALLRVLIQRIPDDALRVLGITDVDLFVQQLNFVFGEATVDGRVGIISLRRLRPDFYGETPNEDLFIERAVTEAVHELGHTFGLRHCSIPTCVMYFSNNIADTDRKSAHFCADHAHQLALKLRPIRKAA